MVTLDRELDRRAMTVLRAGPRGQLDWCVDPLVFALVMPSFRPPTAYEAWRTRSGKLQVTRTRWRRDVDHIRLHQAGDGATHTDPPTPTIEIAEGMLESAEFERLFAALLDTAVPSIVNPRQRGLDGVTYELGVAVDAVAARYKWWSIPPAGWEPLATFLHEFTRLAESAVRPLTEPARAT